MLYTVVLVSIIYNMNQPKVYICPLPLSTSLHLTFSFYFHTVILEAPRIQVVLLRILLRPLLLLPPCNSVSTPCILWSFITFAPLWFLLPGIHRLPTQCTFKPSLSPPQSLFLLAWYLRRALTSFLQNGNVRHSYLDLYSFISYFLKIRFLMTI